MAIHLTPEANPTVQEGTLYVDSATGEFNVAGRTVPHIIPGVLYPAVSGKLLDGTTDHGTGTYDGVSVSTNYGTTQSDGRKYYYTDIKGSKPIKDPRIGGHFGSQRHKFKSLQLLEQETATHGENVYSVDGREWIRGVGDLSINNNSRGNFVFLGNDGTNSVFIEITGYFNDVNILMFNEASRSGYDYKINGGSNTATDDTQFTAVTSPLDGRYVDAMAVHNINIGTISTPAIQTLKITRNTSTNQGRGQCGGIELIAQDTSSTANRSKIQIPSQDVVSYGKKFTVSGTPHYDPFNGFTSGSSVTSYIDTATSLGVEKWKNSSTYYRPYNGGRVVKWVDSSGTIKTSVTLMPPNAKSMADSSSLTNATAKANASASNDTFYPTFEAHTTDVNEDQLHEVAKTFHWREFGNGSANEGTGGANYADASMLTSSADNIAYVMDDGLTSLSGSVYGGDNIRLNANPSNIYITFIGTGISFENNTEGNHGGTDDFKWYLDGIEIKRWQTGNSAGKYTLAQNLPYGTHILRLNRVTANTMWQELKDDITFHQPKRPPIPEDAVVLADYMLLADFVPQTSYGQTNISKGVRVANGTRDWFYDASSSFSANTGVHTTAGPAGFYSVATQGSGTGFAQLPFFGTTGAVQVQDSHRAWTLELNGTGVTEVQGDAGSDNYHDLVLVNNSDKATLGLNTLKCNFITGGYHYHGGYVDSPIHTSSHYQSFETPFLYELVGGDRNMEQTNLVVSPDGKTWDEVTRDTSYIGSMSLCQIRTGSAVTSHNSDVVFDDCRGKAAHTTGAGYGLNLFNKDFAIAYDRFICLRDGEYEISTYSNSAGVSTGGNMGIQVSTATANHALSYANPGDTTNTNMSLHNSSSITLNKGDYIRIQGRIGSLVGSWIQIKRLS